MSKYENFLATYSGRELLKKFSLDSYGSWHILGEDPNCDLGGHHYQPDLGYVEGKLKDVIAYAVELKNFWTWGGGGSIVPMPSFKKITPDLQKQRTELNNKAEELRKQLAEVEARLKEI